MPETKIRSIPLPDDFSQRPDDFFQRIVGIGASAGGIEAFQHFFEHMPPSRNIGFVVVLHMAPDRPSMLADIIGHWTTMPVVQATDGMAVEMERIYVNPPNAIVTIEAGRLRVRGRTGDRQELLPIDVFFNSLAVDRGAHGVGVVLSGTGTDGALGLKAIKAAGGIAIAQGRGGSSPQYGSMPEAAVATGIVDAVLPAEAMLDYILGLARPETLLAPPAMDLARQREVEVARLAICAALRTQTGHDFSHYKEQTFLRRVQRRMQATNLDAAGYLEKLTRDTAEVVLLFRDLLIGVTSFFRDPDTFEAARKALPRLFEGKGAGDSVRVWVPGCSTGEEAYSLAMLLREYMDTLEHPPRLQIFGTDIDEPAITIARSGRYPALLLKPVSPKRRARFFTAGTGSYAVTRELRDLCTFSTHSVIRDPPFSRLDIVSCRNLLIYLDTQLQAHVIPAFHYALKPGGILLLGRSEAITRHTDLFTVLDKKNRIFARSDGLTPTLRMSGAPNAGQAPPPQPSGAGNMKASSAKAVQAASARVQSHYAPAYVIADAAGDALHYAPRVERYLELGAGTPTRNVVAMARRGLKSELRLALRRSIASGRSVTQQHVRVETAGGPLTITLTVEPLPVPDSRAVYLIVFAEQSSAQPGASEHVPGSHPRDELVEQHEREQQDLREQIQSTSEEYDTAVEELKSANEELHSTNEELQSSNEELETSKEEIESVNEELHTVNDQLVRKVDDLDKANSDLKNLFESTKVATVFLDRHLIIRNFTPAIASVYNMIASDTGRPLTDLNSSIDYPTLKADLRGVIDGSEPLERRVARLDGKTHYLMRMLPYRDTDNSVGGALVTFIDVTGMVEAEEHHRLLVDELNHRVKNLLTVIVSLVMQTRRGRTTLDEFCDVFLGRLQALAKAYTLLSQENWVEVSLQDIVIEELAPYQAKKGRTNILMEGPAVALRSTGALALGMILHELATNAVKYGALSTPKGLVTVRWDFKLSGGGEQLVLRWTETGGPAVTPPTRRGFGGRLIDRSIKHELGGNSVVRFDEAGMEAILTIPLSPATVGHAGTRREPVVT